MFQDERRPDWDPDRKRPGAKFVKDTTCPPWFGEFQTRVDV